MKQFIIIMPCFTQFGSADQGQSRPVDKDIQVGIRHMRLTIASTVRQYNARRKDRSSPKLVFRPIFGEDQLSSLEKMIPADKRLLVIPVPYIPKDKTLAPFATKPEHARFALTIPAPGIQFGAKICGKCKRVRVGTFARQIVQWAAYIANNETKSQLPWRVNEPLRLDKFYVSEADYVLQKKKNANTDTSGPKERKKGYGYRLLKADRVAG